MLLALALQAWPTVAFADRVVAIVHESNTTDEVNLRRLRLLYSGFQGSWGDGTRVDLVLPEPGTDAMTLLADRVFKLGSEREIQRYYLHAIFQERITKRPQQLRERDAVRAVERNPGGLALVSVGSVPADARVRTIEIGKPNPGQ